MGSESVKKWFNPRVFEKGEEDNDEVSNVDARSVEAGDAFENEPTFEIAFDSRIGGQITVKRCSEVLSLGVASLLPSEHNRWSLTRDDCEAFDRYDRAPDFAKSEWRHPFGFDLLRTFPATASPETGGDGLGYLQGLSIGQLTDLELVQADGNAYSVDVRFEGMSVRYTLVSRGDFNWDGYEDYFIRLEYSVDEAMGSAVGWLVLTQRPGERAPIVLWRK